MNHFGQEFEGVRNLANDFAAGVSDGSHNVSDLLLMAKMQNGSTKRSTSNDEIQSQTKKRLDQEMEARIATKLLRNPDKTFGCTECEGYSVKNIVHMKRHIESAHLAAKRFICTECREGFSENRLLRDHTRSFHKANANFKCEACEKLFVTASRLQKHVDLAHNKVKPFMCESCGHRAARKSSLQLHVKRMHSGDKAKKKPD